MTTVAPAKPSRFFERDHLHGRARRTREIVINAAIELTAERGVQGCTIEAIHERTRVAKTSIYRHWPSRNELLMDVAREMSARSPRPDSGSLRDDLIEYFVAGNRDMQHLHQTWAAIPGLLDAARREPRLAEASQRAVSTLVTGVRAILERGLERGEIGQGRNLEVLVNALVGAVFVQRGFRGVALTRDYIVESIDAVLDSAARAAPVTRP